MMDQDLPLTALVQKRPAPGANATGGKESAQQKKKAKATLAQADREVAPPVFAEGRRPRVDQQPPKVVDCLLSCADIVVKDPPIQTEKVPNQQSAEISKRFEQARLKGTPGDVPIAKSNRENYVWVGKMRGNAGDVYTINPSLLEKSPKFRDENDNKCDICGKQCGELFIFRAFKRLPSALEDSSESLRSARAERCLLPFISYVGIRCGQNLLGKQTPLSMALDNIISDLDKSEDSELALANIMNSISTMPEKKANLYKKAIAIISERAMKKHKQQRQAAGGPMNQLRPQQPQAPKSNFGPRFNGYAKEDKGIDPNNTTTEYVSETLWNLTWPICYTRQNVTPEGQAYIYAFPVGLVQNYCYGPQTSSSLTRFPNLSQLILNWFRKENPGFAFTTIQLNRNYAAKLHVDANNWGRSRIIGLPGPEGYTGGDLWILDKDIDEDDPACKYMEITVALKGWPELKVGSMAKGRLISIKNEWLTFDGTIPHCVLPFKGSRISLVFFCRNNHASVPDPVKLSLENDGAGFCWPDENWEGGLKLEAIHGKQVRETRNAKCEKVKVEVSSDEENDEEADGAFVPPMEDWSHVFLKNFDIKRPQQQEDGGPEPLTLVTAHLGVSPFFGLRELLGTEKLTTLAVLEWKRDASRSILEKAANPQKFCINKMNMKGLQEEGEDIFCSAFLMLPFLTRTKNTEGKRFYETDPNFEQFKQLRDHISDRKPKAALIVPDMRGIPLEEVRAVCRCVLEDELSILSSEYSMEICQVESTSFGIPLYDSYVMIVAIRKQDMKQRAAAASDALAVVHHIAKQGFLELTPVQDFVFPEGQHSSLLQDTKKCWKKGVTARKEKDSLFRRMKKLDAEVKATGVDKEAERMPEDWLLNAYNTEKWKALLVKRRALEEADADEKMLIIDLWAKEDSWDDKGFLPRFTGNAWHYLVGRQRMLSGVEHLALRGVPARRVPELVRLNSDESLVTLACRTVPVPILGAALLGIMLTTELGEARGLVLQESQWSEVRSAIPTGAHDITKITLQTLLPDEVSQSIDGRAMQLGFLLNHAGFKAEEKKKKQEKKEEKEKEKEVKAEEKKSTVITEEPNTSANDVAMEEPESEAEDSESSASEGEVAEEVLEEKWAERRGLLQVRPPAFRAAEMPEALIYIDEALNKIEAEEATNIVVFGLDYIRRHLWNIWTQDAQDIEVPAVLVKAFPDLEAAVQANFRKLHPDVPAALDFLVGLFRACVMQVAWRQKQGDFCLENPNRLSWPRYRIKAKELHPLETIVLLRKALSGPYAKEFMQEVGAELVAAFLEEARKANIEEVTDIAKSDEFSKMLLQYVKLPQMAVALHRFYSAVDEKNGEVVSKAEQELVEAGCKTIALALGDEGSVEDRPVYHETLEMLSRGAEKVAEHWDFVKQSIDECLNVLPQKTPVGRMELLQRLTSRAVQARSTAPREWPKLYRALEAAFAKQVEAAKVARRKEDEKAKRESEKAKQEKKAEQEQQHREKLKQAEEKLLANLGKADEKLRALKSKPLEPESHLQALTAVLAKDVFRLDDNSEEFRKEVIDRCCRQTVDSIYAIAQEAAQWPARLQKVRRWLCKQGFGPILPALSARFDAQSFVEMLADSKSPSPPVGLPESLRTSLMAKVSSLPRDAFKMGDELPQGWKMRTSSSSGMKVYAKNGREQLAYPVEGDVNFERPPVPEPSYGAGITRKDIAPYIDFDAVKKSLVLCSLCEEAGLSHLQSAEHRVKLDFWALFVNVVKDVKEELRKLDLKPTVKGLGDIWQHYLLSRLEEKVQAIIDSKDGDPEQTFRTFWHRCVLRCWQEAKVFDHSKHIVLILTNIVKLAELKEPCSKPKKVLQAGRLVKQASGTEEDALPGAEEDDALPASDDAAWLDQLSASLSEAVAFHQDEQEATQDVKRRRTTVEPQLPQATAGLDDADDDVVIVG